MALKILVITANFKRVIVVFAFAPSCRFDNPCDLRASSYAKVGIQKATELCVWWFCTKHNVPVSLDPLKRTFVAVALLLLILQKELTGNGDFFRVGRRAQITRIVKTTGRRKGENDYNPFEVCSYD